MNHATVTPNILGIIREKQITQMEIALKSDFTQGLISQFLSGKPVRASTATALSKAVREIEADRIKQAEQTWKSACAAQYHEVFQMLEAAKIRTLGWYEDADHKDGGKVQKIKGGLTEAIKRISAVQALCIQSSRQDIARACALFIGVYIKAISPELLVSIAANAKKPEPQQAD